MGDRFKGSKVIGVETKGVKITEYKFVNGVLSLFNDRELFGENLGETTIDITFEGVNGIRVEAQISVVIFTESEEVFLEETQEIFIGRENSVDLKQFSGATVYSISCNGYYFGNDINSLNIDSEFRTNPLIHGNNTLTVLIGKDDKFYTLQIPVTVITKEISNVDQFNELLKSDNAEYAIYGYYKLTADIGDDKSEFNNGNDTNWQNVDGLYGFRGTFDGNGKSISAIIYANGIFGIVGKGAYIKNLTVNSYNYINRRTILARSITEATIENVTINVVSGSSNSYYEEGGVITALLSHSSKYINVKIKSSSDLDTLFGFSYWNYNPAKYNTFENCTVEAKSIGGIICITTQDKMAEPIVSIAGVEGLKVTLNKDTVAAANMTVGQAAVIELPDLTEITSIVLDDEEFTAYSFENGVLTINADAFTAFQIGNKKFGVTAKNEQGLTVVFEITTTVELVAVTLEGVREIVLSSGTTFDIDLGGYTSAKVLSATLGGESVTYSNGKLTIAEELRANTQKHGMQTLKVTVEKEGKYYNVIASVLVVTQEISDMDSLTAALTPTEGSSVVYGYYRLSEDLSSTGWYSVGYAAEWTAVQRSNADLGFRGTFDGNGKTISSWFYGDGLFGVVGNGAVIKNLTINNKQYQGGNGNFNTLFGYSMMGATMDKVTINILKGGKADIATNAAGGLLTCLGGYGNTLKNVTINAEGLAIDTLFGTGCWFNYPKDYAPNTFENCFITAKSLIGLACTDNANKIVTPYSGIDGLTVTAN